MPRKILVDTNPALLLVVGLTDRAYVARHKRLAAYDLSDYDALAGLVEASGGLVFCPNVWSGTSNLVRYASEPYRGEISRTLKRMVDATDEVDELYVATKQAIRREEYVRLGVTDCVLLSLAASASILLTDDLPLYLAAITAGYDAMNYNHIRERRYESR